MTAMPAAQTMTAEEFLALPLDADEYGWAPCLVEGELVVTQPTLRHQRAVGRLFRDLADWADAGPRRGEAILPLAVVLDNLNVYAPDLVWYAEHHSPEDPRARAYAMPDLVVEVRSPSTWRYDIGAKKSGYEREGLRELWLVDTAATEVLVFRRSATDAPAFDTSLQLGAGDMLESPQLPGFELPVERVFADR
jgi:Uma2 family endonuclease